MGTLLQRWGKAKKASSAKKQRGREAQAAKFSGTSMRPRKVWGRKPSVCK